MNKAQAQAWVDEITKSLTGKTFIEVASGPGDQVRVRQSQQFKKAYFVEHADGDCVVAISTTWGVMTGAGKWSIDPSERSFHAQVENGFGESLHFVYAINHKGGSAVHKQLRQAQEKLWKVR